MTRGSGARQVHRERRVALPQQSRVRHEVRAADDRHRASVIRIANDRTVVATDDRRSRPWPRRSGSRRTEPRPRGSPPSCRSRADRRTCSVSPVRIAGARASLVRDNGSVSRRSPGTAASRRSSSSPRGWYVSATTSSESGRAARSTSATESASTTSTPLSRNRETSARAPSGLVDSASIRPPGRLAVSEVANAETPTIRMSANSTHLMVRHRDASVGPTARGGRRHRSAAHSSTTSGEPPAVAVPRV